MELFIIFVGIFLIFLVSNTPSVDKITKKLFIVYLIWWIVPVSLSDLGLEGLYHVTNWSMSLQLLHLCAFTLGVLYYKKRKKSLIVNKNSFGLSLEKQISNIIDNKFFIGILIISLIIVIHYFIIYQTQVAFFGKASIARSAYYEGELFGPSFYYINGLLLRPVNFICLTLFGYAIFKKRNWVCLLMGTYLVLKASLNASRFEITYIIFAVFFMNIIIVKKDITKKIPLLLVAGLLFYVVLSYTTAIRHGYFDFTAKSIYENGMKLTNEQLITYDVGAQVAFNYALEHDYLGKMGGYSYGGITFCSFTNFINFITARLGLTVNQAIEDYAQLAQNNVIMVGDVTEHNALYTSSLIYYLDAGIIGIIIFPFIFGICFHYLVRKTQETESVWICIINCEFYVQMLKSAMNWGFTSAFDFLFLLFVVFMATRKKTSAPTNVYLTC